MAEANYRCNDWRPFHEAWELPEDSLIVATYEDWSGGEILIRKGETFCELDGEPTSMLPDLRQFQEIGVDRCPHERAERVSG